MSTIIAGRFEEEVKARQAPPALEAAGFPAGSITIFFVTPAGQHDMHGTPADPEASAGAHHAGAGAVVGAAAGTGVGAAVGLAAFPLVGPAGPIAGAAIGAYVGSLAGAVSLLDPPEQESGGPANPDVTTRERPPRRSGYLVGVDIAAAIDQARAIDVLRNAGASEVERAEGRIVDGEWDDFDPIAAPRLVA